MPGSHDLRTSILAMMKFLTVLVLAGLMAVAIAMIDSQSAGLADAPRPATAASNPSERIYATGIVEGMTEDIHLRPEQAGRVTEVLVFAGDWVDAGQVVVRLDNARQQQQVALAAANLELAQAELERLNNGARAEERARGPCPVPSRPIPAGPGQPHVGADRTTAERTGRFAARGRRQSGAGRHTTGGIGSGRSPPAADRGASTP